MENLKYDSIYKFIVSLGVILTVLPGFVVCYIFNNNEVVLVNTEEKLKQIKEGRQVTF